MKETALSVRTITPVYYVTLLLGSFLLFAIQPLFAKMVLPLLGGASGVWITAMLFFQLLLLAGYGYAYLMARYVPLKWQFVLHPALIALCALSLPIAVPAGWIPPVNNNPAFWQLGLMAFAIGGPFFALSGGAPLLQHWFAHSGHPEAKNPYFLYAASNVGSMAALLSYPLLIEPFFATNTQSYGWSGAYSLLLGLVIATALISKNSAADHNAGQAIDENPPPTLKEKLWWIFLAFIPSSLMLGVTTHITMDIAAIPLLWIIPLALYLLTFIMAFTRSDKDYMRGTEHAQLFLLCAALFIFMKDELNNSLPLIGFHLSLFFVSALVCHTALYLKRPSAKHLTLFYMMVALGGVCGGVFNAILAPMLFKLPIEYCAVIGLACLARMESGKNAPALDRTKKITYGLACLTGIATAVLCLYSQPDSAARYAGIAFVCAMVLTVRNNKYVLSIVVTAALLIHSGYGLKNITDLKYLSRNYYGVLRVYETQNSYQLVDGVTKHGMQPLMGSLKKVPMAYYHPSTPAGDVFSWLNRRTAPQTVAAIGLGVGSIACYPYQGRHFDFYELNPAMVTVAENKHLFTYLSDCGSPYKIILGDGRLQIAKAPDHSYDLIFVDAFSSDSIPVHLLTREAMTLYESKLKPGGLIIFHISNKYLSLKRVIAATANSLDLYALFKTTPERTVPAMMAGDTQIMVSVDEARYAIVTNNQDEALTMRQIYGWALYDKRGRTKPWRDDFSNLPEVLTWRQE